VPKTSGLQQSGQIVCPECKKQPRDVASKNFHPGNNPVYYWSEKRHSGHVIWATLGFFFNNPGKYIPVNVTFRAHLYIPVNNIVWQDPHPLPLPTVLKPVKSYQNLAWSKMIQFPPFSFGLRYNLETFELIFWIERLICSSPNGNLATKQAVCIKIWLDNVESVEMQTQLWRESDCS
jgi:hypothetical protein